MKMTLVPFAFVCALLISSSGAAVTELDRSADVKPAKPVVAVADRTQRVVDVDYQLSDQERFLIAYSRLKANTEQGAR